MSQYLPCSGFKWLNQKNQKNIDRFDVNSVSENSWYGYILEVDPEYSNKVHEVETECLWRLLWRHRFVWF